MAKTIVAVAGIILMGICCVTVYLFNEVVGREVSDEDYARMAQEIVEQSLQP